MTLAERIEWCKNASNEELVEQFKWAVLRTNSDNIPERVEACEDFVIAKNEMLARMSK